MKKNVFLVLGLLVLGITKAQDTIPFMDSCFSYSVLLEVPSMSQIDHSSLDGYVVHHAFPRDVATFYQYIIPSGTEVLGIAVFSFDTALPSNLTLGSYTFNQSTGQMQTINSVVGHGNPFHKKMYYTFPRSYNRETADIVPCHLYLFDHKAIVPDTFYVGHSSEGYSYDYINRPELQDYIFEDYIRAVYPHAIAECVLFQGGGNAHFNSQGFGSPDLICHMHLTGYVPILSLPCPKPWKPSIGFNMSGRVDFRWKAGDTALYQLAFYSYPDDNLVFVTDTLVDTTFRLVDSIAPANMVDGRYHVRLRKACSYAGSPYGDVVWSDWSEPRQFLYMHSTAGIDATDGQTPVFLLSPNPAKGTVTVEMGETQRDASPQTIQVVDMEGRVVLTQPWESAAAQPLTLDISGLAAGVYLVRLNTPQGTATRKLVVE